MNRDINIFILILLIFMLTMIFFTAIIATSSEDDAVRRLRTNRARVQRIIKGI